jgi:mannose-6-phosphate isomerase-like protein (cupin superfamily)
MVVCSVFIVSTLCMAVLSTVMLTPCCRQNDGHNHTCMHVIKLLILPIIVVMLSGLSSSCSSCRNTPASGRIIQEQETWTTFAWSDEEKTKPIAVRRVRATHELSVNYIRLAGAEKPHIHQTHDLVVVMLRGQARLHIGDRQIDVVPGDIMEIPRGVVHWAENIGNTASEVYAIFSPPYDGLDNIPVLPIVVPTKP